VENSQKLLASGTRARYSSLMEDTWADIPDLPHGYEVSTTGRVRKWITSGGRAYPKLYTGCPEGSTVVYQLQGEKYTIDELMRMAFGDEADEMEAGYDPRERDRDLTQYERSEIVQAEGWKPAFEVAADFRIDTARVRQIWDGDA